MGEFGEAGPQVRYTWYTSCACSLWYTSYACSLWYTSYACSLWYWPEFAARAAGNRNSCGPVSSCVAKATEVVRRLPWADVALPKPFWAITAIRSKTKILLLITPPPSPPPPSSPLSAQCHMHRWTAVPLHPLNGPLLRGYQAVLAIRLETSCLKAPAHHTTPCPACILHLAKPAHLHPRPITTKHLCITVLPLNSAVLSHYQQRACVESCPRRAVVVLVGVASSPSFVRHLLQTPRRQRPERERELLLPFVL
jgi:hypothetical protein